MNGPTWEVVTTDAGHHLRLKGGNGETVLTSEVYTETRTALNALNVVRESLNPGAFAYRDPEYVDERTPGKD